MIRLVEKTTKALKPRLEKKRKFSAKITVIIILLLLIIIILTTATTTTYTTMKHQQWLQ